MSGNRNSADQVIEYLNTQVKALRELQRSSPAPGEYSIGVDKDLLNLFAAINSLIATLTRFVGCITFGKALTASLDTIAPNTLNEAAVTALAKKREYLANLEQLIGKLRPSFEPLLREYQTYFAFHRKEIRQVDSLRSAASSSTFEACEPAINSTQDFLRDPTGAKLWVRANIYITDIDCKIDLTGDLLTTFLSTAETIKQLELAARAERKRRKIVRFSPLKPLAPPMTEAPTVGASPQPTPHQEQALTALRAAHCEDIFTLSRLLHTTQVTAKATQNALNTTSETYKNQHAATLAALTAIAKRWAQDSKITGWRAILPWNWRPKAFKAIDVAVATFNQNPKSAKAISQLLEVIGQAKGATLTTERRKQLNWLRAIRADVLQATNALTSLPTINVDPEAQTISLQVPLPARVATSAHSPLVAQLNKFSTMAPVSAAVAAEQPGHRASSPH